MQEHLPENVDFPAPERGIFCNRTLNLRSLPAIGFDMDYTLVHYQVEEWERRAYEHMRRRLVEQGWPVGHLEFDPDMFALGLILDLELGNVVKANRFGFVKKAAHGTQMLGYEEQREAYGRVIVDLGEPRWVFMNTLFGLSEGTMFMQAVELLDEDKIEDVMGYAELYRTIRASIDETHMEGALKSEIISNPERFVVVDEELPLALLDLRHAGKKLLLITNSEWSYSRPMMEWAFDRHLPGDMTWRDLFHVTIVSSGKPGFFNQRRPLFEVINAEGMLRPVRELKEGGVFLGGNAGQVEEFLGLPGESILYVGDHIFGDVRMSKSVLRWRTALITRHLEEELQALEAFKPKQRALSTKMAEKEVLEHQYSQLRIRLQRLEKNYGPQPDASAEELQEGVQSLRAKLLALDAEISPLAKEASELSNKRWGLLMRAGNDKSHLARQMERYADIYTSRVSNLLTYTPFVYLRSPRGSLPHDSGPAGGFEVAR
ncbi:MAG: HAD-IG family 5'-nucleotidase [Myxococcota bacterium]